MEVIKTEKNNLEDTSEPKIYGIKISFDGGVAYCISVRHTGQFNLRDYEELDFDVATARLVRKRQ